MVFQEESQNEPAVTGTLRKKSYTVKINPSWCKSCRICAAFCPKKVLSLSEDGAPVVSNPEACTGCMLCELRCPDFAIEVIREEKEEKGEEEGGDGRVG